MNDPLVVVNMQNSCSTNTELLVPQHSDGDYTTALKLCNTDHPASLAAYVKTDRRSVSRRGVIWLGQTCNLHCRFCYFIDRIHDNRHPEHPFMPLEKAKRICRTLVKVYGNTAVDIEGGEPTIYPHILELLAYCNEIGLYPTLITNAITLDDSDRCRKMRAGAALLHLRL